MAIRTVPTIDSDGATLTPLDAPALRADLLEARQAGLRTVAIILMHGWKFPEHERKAAAIARSLGFEEVSVSHELSPLVRYVVRGDTTVLNAYLALPLRQYVSGLQRELHTLDPGARLELMQSNGGLAAADTFHAMSSVLSGPAGGLIGMQWIGNHLGIPWLVGFDMGGTSTDVSLLDGELPRRFEHIIAGVRLQSPMLDVHTIAAGGGSILHFTDGRFAAGPDSAGADPGPACYGRDGPLTLTDVQVLLGHLRPDTLPPVFGHDGRARIDTEVVARKFAALASRVAPDAGTPAEVEVLAESFLEVAVEAMANAIRQVSTRQGLDAAEFTLFCFGGAAGQHACRVARAAGMRRVLIHPLASVLSAFGIGVADRLAMRRASLRLPLTSTALSASSNKLRELEGQARGQGRPVAAAIPEPAAVAPPEVLTEKPAPDPARIEIFNNLFMHIAEQMGEVLEATAQSVNIKERLDYSCALFDASGGLVANAPHMPVHLGSMGASVRAVIDTQGSNMNPGDSWLLNSPYHGGTHLPDMTVVTPVFLGGTANPDFFVASRAHHADIGGTTPGSMPPFSRTIDEEGALFECFPLVVGGTLRERELRDALASALFPARNPDQNVADLQAQLAANARGIAEIERAVQRHTLLVVHSFMRHVQDNAAASVRNAIGHLQPGKFRYEMDNGQVIAVRIDIDRDSRNARVDFTGTSAQDPHNFNAPRAVCLAAVLYVFRTLIDRPIPLNEGCLEPLEVIVPAASMLDPSPPAAVAAGNVETSQCIVDALYGALGVLAASQGTMNNLTFGDARRQYYETIAGGAGAGPDFDGCDAVQTHMTNSRLTDPEILESKYPVLVREFSVRRGSGGRGRHRGGDGTVRKLEFRAPMSGALLANHRRIAPFGVKGGTAAARGTASIQRVSGDVEPLGATARFDVAPGDVLTIETPGGGGYGQGTD